MPSALDEIVKKAPSEYGGARAQNRFDYQKDWTLCLLLKLHVSSADYLVICDYHDDVLHFDSFKSLHFYQIKTKAGKYWRISELIYQEPGKAGKLPSILGKLYRNKDNFFTFTGTINFVSNSPIKVDLTDLPTVDSRDSFTFEELLPEKQKELRVALRQEFSLSTDPILDASLIFHISEINFRGHQSHTRGKLLDYLDGLDPSRTYPIKSLYTALSDEIGRRISCESPCLTVVDLKQLKGISRDDFQRFIFSCISESERKDPRRVIQALTAQLQQSGFSFGIQMKIQRDFEKYSLERMNRTQYELRECIKHAQQYCHATLPTFIGAFGPWLSQGVACLRADNVGLNRDDSYIMAIIAWEALTDEWRISPVGPQPTGAQP